MRSRGFRYTVSLNDIRAYRMLSAHDKLAWLEEANRFSAKFIKGKKKIIWEAFRRGTI